MKVRLFGEPQEVVPDEESGNYEMRHRFSTAALYVLL